jgi:hypothetical protein
MTHQRERRVPAPANRRDLTANKFTFIEALACDGALTCLERRVGTLLISRYLHSESLLAWPSAEQLARNTGSKPRSIRRAIKRLVELGWFMKVRAGGRGKSNRYSANWSKVSTLTARSANPDTLVRKTLTCGTGEPIERNPSMNPGIAHHLYSEEEEGQVLPDTEDWRATSRWLARMGGYEERFGFGSDNLASDDLARWRRENGDAAMLRAVERAKQLSLYGEPLRDYLANTLPTSRHDPDT